MSVRGESLHVSSKYFFNTWHCCKDREHVEFDEGKVKRAHMLSIRYNLVSFD